MKGTLRKADFSKTGLLFMTLTGLLLAGGLIVSSTGSRAATKIDIQGPKTAPDTKAEAQLTTDKGLDTYFDKLDEALRYASGKTGWTVKLFRDVERTSSLKISYKKVTLDLNGYTLSRKKINYADGGEVIRIQKGADVTIIDSRPEEKNDAFYHGKGGVIANGSSKNSAGGIQVESGAKLTMTGGTVHGCVSKFEGGALRNEGGTVNLTGVSFSGNASDDNGGAILHQGGRMVLTECVMESNFSKKSGGAIMIKGENIDLHDCEIEDNTCKDNGGGIAVRQNKVFLDGGSIRHNKAEGSGSGVYVDSYRDINIQGTLLIVDNKDKKGNPSNLVLQDGMASGARAYDGGLLPGSKVSINKTGNLGEGYKSIIGVTDYEIKNGFFTTDRGKTELKDTVKKKETFMGTLVGRYGGSLILIGLLVLIGAFFSIRIVRIRKKKAAVEELVTKDDTNHEMEGRGDRDE